MVELPDDTANAKRRDSELPNSVGEDSEFDTWQAELPTDSDVFRQSFEDAAIGMAIVGLSGRFRRVNQALCAIVGYDETELLGRTFLQITHRDDLGADLLQVGRALSGEIDHFHREKRYIHKDGHLVWVLLACSVVRGADNRPCYFIVQMHDITVRKLADGQLTPQAQGHRRLTHIEDQILREFESDGLDDEVYQNVLKIALNAFDSRAGLFLRYNDAREFVGPIFAFGTNYIERCPVDGCELWTQSLSNKSVTLENAPRDMGCGTRLVRSLVGPILYDDEPIGLVHLANSDNDYEHDDRDLLTRLLQVFAPALRARMLLARLTKRESDVMDLIVMGMAQKEIAAWLRISVQTVAKHRTRVLEKLSARGDVDLVYLSLQRRANRLSHS